MRDFGHLWRVRGRGLTCAGGELAGGGPGRDAFEWEGQSGNIAEGVGGQKGRKRKDGRPRKEKVPRVFGEKEGKEGQKAEDRRHA